LRVDPERLEQFAEGVEELIPVLETLRARQADAAWCRSPSTDPATMRATARLAEDGYDIEGTPPHVIARVISDLRQQAVAARLAARDFRAQEDTAVEDINKAGEQEP
jgi:hypothetical protein